jgi:hypothetical protein
VFGGFAVAQCDEKLFKLAADVPTFICAKRVPCYELSVTYAEMSSANTTIHEKHTQYAE